MEAIFTVITSRLSCWIAYTAQDWLKRLCAPDLGEDEYDVMDVPENWPDHLDEAIHLLNRQILPLLKFLLNELLLGLVVNTPATPVDIVDWR